ncbi:MAG TPA: hypothetical protein VHN80_29045, partial [Kineosporiaceae bacterium]|nr:hypothetical protein [Kineosporiaceae bacterium]
AELLAGPVRADCPDCCVNAGGVIRAADEWSGFSFERARASTEQIFDTTLEVLRTAGSEGITPALGRRPADRTRIAEASGLRCIYLRECLCDYLA